MCDRLLCCWSVDGRSDTLSVPQETQTCLAPANNWDGFLPLLGWCEFGFHGNSLNIPDETPPAGILIIPLTLFNSLHFLWMFWWTPTSKFKLRRWTDCSGDVTLRLMLELLHKLCKPCTLPGTWQQPLWLCGGMETCSDSRLSKKYLEIKNVFIVKATSCKMARWCFCDYGVEAPLCCHE